MKRSLIILAAEVAAAVLLHFVLLYWLAEKNVVSSIFAAGSHVPKSQLLLAGGFVLVRVWVVLLLPGMVLYRLTLILRKRS